MLVASVASILCAVLAWPAFAEDPKSPAKIDQELSEKLLEDLSGDLLKGLDLDLPAERAKPSSPPLRGEAPSEAPSPDADDPLDLLGQGEDLGAERQADPLARIGEAMRRVEGRLDAGDTSDRTQSLQRQIAEALATLIQQSGQSNSSSNSASASSSQSASADSDASKAGSQSAAGAPKPGNSAARESTDRLGQADSQEARRRQMDALFKQAWGHLPDRIREEMQSASAERFLPKYETIIEEYFRRLAKESAGAASPEP